MIRAFSAGRRGRSARRRRAARARRARRSSTSSRQAAQCARWASKASRSSSGSAPSRYGATESDQRSWSVVHQRITAPPDEPVAHLLQPEPHAALDGADRRLEHLGDLGVGEAAEVGQLDHLALLGRQRRPSRRARSRPRRGGRPRRRCARAASKRSSMPSSLARRLSWTVARRRKSIARWWTMPEHPGAHGALGALVARAGAPDVQERLLADVLGAVAAAHDPVGERERRRGVALVDDLERAGACPRRTSCIRSSSARARRSWAIEGSSLARPPDSDQRLGAASSNTRSASRATSRSVRSARSSALWACGAALVAAAAGAQDHEAGAGARPRRAPPRRAGSRRAASCAGRASMTAPTPPARRRPARRACRAWPPCARRAPPAARSARARRAGAPRCRTTGSSLTPFPASP